MLNKEMLLMVPSGKVLIGQFHFYTASSKAAVYWGAFDSEGIHRNGYIWMSYVNSGDAVYGQNAVRSNLNYAFQDFIYKAYPAVVYYKDKLVGELIGEGIFKFSTSSGYIDSLWRNLEILNYSTTTFNRSLDIYLK